MKAFEELVEEVYQDGDLRPEFSKYAQLLIKTQQHTRLRAAQYPLVPVGQYQFLGYAEIGQIGTQPVSNMTLELGRMGWGLAVLSSTLFKTLSLRYPLPKEELQRLRDAVIARYVQTL